MTLQEHADTIEADLDRCEGCCYLVHVGPETEPRNMAPECPVCLRSVALGDLQNPEDGCPVARRYWHPGKRRWEQYTP